MKRAIRPAVLVLLALVVSAAAPAPDVRAAPPWTVPHGDAARPRDPLPSALQGRPLGGQAPRPGVAFDGTNYLVVWTDSREGGPKVYGARVSPGGTVLDQDGFAISAAGGSEPAVAFDGTNYLVVWSNQASIIGARVDPGGTVLDPGGITISTRPNHLQYEPTLAFDGTNYLVVWIHREPRNRRLRRARVSVRDRARPRGDRDRRGPGITSTCLRSPSTGRTTSSSGRTTRATASWAGESAKAGSRTATVAS